MARSHGSKTALTSDDPRQYPAGQLIQPTTTGSQGRATECAGRNNAISPAHTDLTKTDLRAIKLKLEDGREESVSLVEDDRDWFIPRDLIEEVLTEPTIQSLLEKDQNCCTPLNTIVGDKKRVKIFTILVLMNSTKHLGRIVRTGVWDDDLPLKKRYLESIFRTLEENSSEDASHFIYHQPLVAVPAWDFTTPDMEEIQDYPSRFHNMPFLKKQRLSHGGQGLIWKVQIHPAHFTGTRTGSNRWERFHRGPEFAVKEFTKEEEFRQELSALRFFHQTKTKHKHLIRVLAAYSQGRSHFLILPLARGNLVEFLSQDGPLSKDPVWLLRQCCGLTDGLRRIHRCKAPPPPPQHAAAAPRGRRQRGSSFIRGRHGDIKPPNILWFADGGGGGGGAGENRLVLSDFTLVRFHARGSETDTLVDGVGRTRTYRAPELDLSPPDGGRGPGRRVSQKYDTWSLGCVFLEVASCHLVGFQATRGERHFEDGAGRGYETFSTTRVVEDPAYEDKYFIQGPGGRTAEVKRSVKDWFSYLQGLEHCSAAMSDFLDLIRDHMLVVNPDARWGSKKVLRRLRQIQNQRSNPERYYLSAGARGTFHPSPLLRPWDEPSYNLQLLHSLNHDPGLVTFSGLKPSPTPDHQDLELIEATFLPQPWPSSTRDGPGRRQTTTTAGYDTAPEAQSHTAPETPQPPPPPQTPRPAQDASGRCSLEPHTPPLARHGGAPGAARLLRTTPSPASGPRGGPSPGATSILTRDRMRRSASSSRSGRSTLVPDEDDMSGQGRPPAAGKRPACGGGTAGPGGSSAGGRLAAVRGAWASLRRRLRAVWRRGHVRS